MVETLGRSDLLAEPEFPVFLQVLSALDILQPPQIDCFEEMYPSWLLLVPRHLLRTSCPTFLTVPIVSCFLMASFSSWAAAARRSPVGETWRSLVWNRFTLT